MNWIDKPIEERQLAVSKIDDLIEDECPDRFWYSSDQDSETTQEMRILLPFGDSIYYDVRIQTSQLKSLRLLSEAFGHTDSSVKIPPEILDRIGVLGEEVFDINKNHEYGILYSAVIDVPGLTHIVIDSLLNDFLSRNGSPPQPKKINPQNLLKRILEAEDGGYLEQMYNLKESVPE